MNPRRWNQNCYNGMVKKIIIVLIVLAVATLGYFQYTNSSSPTETKSPAASSGKTIDLSNKNVSEVSKDLLDNSSVTTLNVSGNNIKGALPAEIRKLINLEVLNASDNDMTGIPAEIGQLSKLRIANFANNDISGLPQEIGNLKNLETLDLRGNPNVSRQDLSQIRSQIPNATVLTD